MKNATSRLLFMLAIMVYQQLTLQAQTLQQSFLDPPESTRPWSHWYWINGNISREGITKDLESMNRVGIGTALIGDQWFDEQPVGDVPILSDKWWNMTVHAVKEARRLGIDIGLFNCPGWSQSGGPWVKPEQSMRYLTSTETRVMGPTKFSQKLPSAGKEFQDVAVLAFPAPSGELETLASRKPEISSVPSIDRIESLTDGSLDTAVEVASGGPGTRITIDVEVIKPFTARSVTLSPSSGDLSMHVEVLALIDDNFQLVRSFKFDRRNPRITVGPMPYGPVIASLPPTTSNQFRLICSQIEGSGEIAEIEISTTARIELAVEKQLGKMHPTPSPQWEDYQWQKTPEPGDDSFVVDPVSVKDLSKYLNDEGRLHWIVPDGQWVIQSIGMLPTGVRNSPAAPHATGLEVDKLSRKHLVAHFDAFVGELLRRLSPEDRDTFKYVVSESYEVGPLNWTEGMQQAFEQTTGYDPTPYWPVLSGRVVNSAEASDRFLWDLRRLVADRVAEEYVGGLRDLCHENGLKLWGENYGHWGFPGEFMSYGGKTDLISGEFWVTGSLGNIECRAASSTAHAYGKQIVYAEAFTSAANWIHTPYDLKARGDWAFTEGINHFVLHLYIHQPSDDFVPGMNAWFGTDFNRHNTWFTEARDWINYLRRCHVMLQHGRHVSDFAYFIGEDAPIMSGTLQPKPPAGYDYDFINAEVLLNRVQVQNGRWTLPEGKSYEMLVLPPLKTMRPGVLIRLRELVAAGGILYGEAPQRSPSLQDWPHCDELVEQIAEEMWNGLKPGVTGHRDFGKGRIFQGSELEYVVRQLNLKPDVSGIEPGQVLWTHRKTPAEDIYFLSNQKAETVELVPTFRSGMGRVPEFWYAYTGKTETCGWYQSTERGTSIPLTLGPASSMFVVFREKTQFKGAPLSDVQGPGRVHVTHDKSGLQISLDSEGEYSCWLEDGTMFTLTVEDLPLPLDLDNPWELSFDSSFSSPETIELTTPELWSENEIEAIRHYSGTASYRTRFKMPAKRMSNQSLRFNLNLGNVAPMARVILNDNDLGLLWKPPYQIDVTDALQPGDNTLEVAVTNTWNNRLVGEAKYPQGLPGQEGKLRFVARSSFPAHILPDTPLQPAGLSGPVRIESSRLMNLSD